MLGAQLRLLKAQILEFDRRIMVWHRSNETSRRLDEILGVGPALATPLVASIANPRAFRSPRLVPSRTRVVAGKSLATSPSEAIDICAQPVYSRRAGRDLLRQDPWHQAPTLALPFCSCDWLFWGVPFSGCPFSCCICEGADFSSFCCSCASAAAAPKNQSWPGSAHARREPNGDSRNVARTPLVFPHLATLWLKLR
jgi:hypothetical protein